MVSNELIAINYCLINCDLIISRKIFRLLAKEYNNYEMQISKRIQRIGEGKEPEFLNYIKNCNLI